MSRTKTFVAEEQGTRASPPGTVQYFRDQSPGKYFCVKQVVSIKERSMLLHLYPHKNSVQTFLLLLADNK